MDICIFARISAIKAIEDRLRLLRRSCVVEIDELPPMDFYVQDWEILTQPKDVVRFGIYSEGNHSRSLSRSDTRAVRASLKLRAPTASSTSPMNASVSSACASAWAMPRAIR